MIIIVLLWIIIFLTGVKSNKNMPCTAFTLDNSMALKGICSIEIMIGHLGVATSSIVLFPNRKAGILFVGVFFAISGYGLMYSIVSKDNYMTNFLPRKVESIIVPAYIVFLIHIILNNVINKYPINFSDFFNVKLFFIETNWYVWEIFLLYIVFYFSVKIDKGLNKVPWTVMFFSILFICVAYSFKIENPWYGSTLCFALGIFYFQYGEKFEDILILRNPVIKLLGCCFILVTSIGLFFIQGGVIGLLISRNIASVFFVIILIIGLYKFGIGNHISLWLGEYSYEIFLFHPVFINILRPWIKNDVFFAWTVIGMTILVSYVYKVCERKLMSIVKKNHKKADM